MPPAEVDIDEAPVRRLVAAQFRGRADLPLTATPTIGWDNALYRLGHDLVVRLPRRRLGADVVADEHRWLPVLVPRLPAPISVPIGLGQPGGGYPWH
jgi:aminoglycoside phosphotransferase (APT) family kinase protein